MNNKIENSEQKIMIFVMGMQMIPKYSGKYEVWNNPGKDYIKHDPEKMTDKGLRDIASVYYPSIGLYDVTDPDYQEYAMQCLKMCYVDIVNYYIESDVDIASNKTAWGVNFEQLVIPMLKKYGFAGAARIAMPIRCVDADGRIDKTFNAILEKFGDNIATINGRPMLPQFSIHNMNPETVKMWKQSWAEAHNGIEPFFMTPQTGYQLVTVDWPSVADGQFGWIELDERKPINEYAENVGDYGKYADLETAKLNHDLMVERAKRYKENGKVTFYAESVTPAFDDVAVWAWNLGYPPRKIEGGENGELYEYKWQSVLKNEPPMVTIPTWDDWGEGTAIEPALEYGIKRLEITRKYAAAYKGIEPNTASLELPGWIYKIRKTTDSKDILDDMQKASDLIANGNFNEAEAIVKPYVNMLQIPQSSTELFEKI